LDELLERCTELTWRDGWERLLLETEGWLRTIAPPRPPEEAEDWELDRLLFEAEDRLLLLLFPFLPPPCTGTELTGRSAAATAKARTRERDFFIFGGVGVRCSERAANSLTFEIIES
jgi:hypothetical protein